MIVCSFDKNICLVVLIFGSSGAFLTIVFTKFSFINGGLVGLFNMLYVKLQQIWSRMNLDVNWVIVCVFILGFVCESEC